MKPSNAIITPEGYPLIAYAAGLFLFLTAGACLLSSMALAVPAFITFLLLLFTVYFFRNPERTPPADEQLMVSPADGVVVYAGPSSEEHIGQCRKISVFMNVFNVHVNRAPFSGKIVDSFYRPGRFLDARSPKASSENEQMGLVVDLPNGARVVYVQIAGLVARRILCYAGVGDSLERGRRYGLIRFGSRVDLYLPEGVEILVKVGDGAVAGVTPLARIV